MGLHLESRDVSIDPLQVFCIISHIAYIPALMILWARRYHYHIPFSFLVLMLLNSVGFHFCQMFDGTACIFSLETHRLYDHITAEYSIILIFILFMMIKNVMWLNLTIVFSFFLFALLKGLDDDSLWFLAGFLVFFGILALWKMRGDEYNPLLFGAFVYLDILALVAYFLYQWYDATHPIWHVLSEMDLAVALIMLFSSKRNRVVSELQKVYPDSHIAFEQLALENESELPFWDTQRETNAVVFYLISWPYSLYRLLTSCNTKKMNLSTMKLAQRGDGKTKEKKETSKRKPAENQIHLHSHSPEVVIIARVVDSNGEIVFPGPPFVF
jgi:hypothetical protein